MDKLKTLFPLLLKNTKLLIIVLIVILVIVFLIFGKNILPGIGSKSVKETTGENATITQAYVSISASGYDSTGGNKVNTALLQYSPLINISTTKDIAKFEIQNVKLTNSIKAQKAFVTWPKHFAQGTSSNTFYEPMGTDQNYPNRKDEGNSFSYKVVDIQRFTDEISKWGGFVDFRYTLYGLGNKVDYEGILNSTKIYSGGKELIYAGLKQSDVQSPIEFDVVITFADKTKAVKHFSLTSDFSEIYNQGFSFKYNSSEYEGKKF